RSSTQNFLGNLLWWANIRGWFMAYLFGRSYPNLSNFFSRCFFFLSCLVCIDVKWVGMLSSCSIPRLFSSLLVSCLFIPSYFILD
ncbi:hypothetical protein J3F84DRAFT_363115, partial [Trichoderma pleuroticola]